jgi:alpha 1,2-mannosyltransferase
MIRPQITVLILVVFLMATFFVLMKRSSNNCEECFKKAGINVDGSLQASAKFSPDVPPKDGGGLTNLKAVTPKLRARAAIVILCRNNDIEGLQKTMPMFEKTFNERFNYPYVFLNDVPFNEEFKMAVRKLSKSKMSFGTIPHEHWSYPPWVNQTKADQSRHDMERRNIIYGGSLPYRHMCRFNSGFFYRHPLLAEYDYYWRVEPYVEFFCDLYYDPFLFMKENNKDYGFTIMVPEYIETIPTLWENVQRYIKEHPQEPHKDNILSMFTKPENGDYNLCHFWSNFEIGSLKFFRSAAYNRFFDYLDQAGGFFYERWGDAPVHSIGAAMLLPKEKIHWFEDIGYLHNPFYNCPVNPALQKHCHCDPAKSNHHHNSCHKEYLKLFTK